LLVTDLVRSTPSGARALGVNATPRLWQCPCPSAVVRFLTL